ncbi:recombinase family protein [Pseudolactococcus insecticola]|uniref:recombinase family protein n=1 Tax=Pseudolactococcus insecticola TaxID=2709158 RepID=UPI001551816A|nr:recombinase family protein [Lactococcus insecticola]
MTITPEQAKAIKRKQADNDLTIEQVAREIGITYITYKKVIKGGLQIKPSVYTKVMEWFAKDY